MPVAHSRCSFDTINFSMINYRIVAVFDKMLVLVPIVIHKAERSKFIYTGRT